MDECFEGGSGSSPGVTHKLWRLLAHEDLPHHWELQRVLPAVSHLQDTMVLIYLALPVMKCVFILNLKRTLALEAFFRGLECSSTRMVVLLPVYLHCDT